MTTNIVPVPTNLTPVVVVNPSPADQNAALVYLASLQPSGRRTQAQVLHVIATWLGGSDLESIQWGALRYQHTAAIRTKAVEEYSPASARKFCAALCGVLKHAWRLGQVGGEEYQRAIDLDPIHGESLPPGRYITEEEMDKLIKVCRMDVSVIGIRDAAMLSMMYVGTLRRDEVTKLTMEDYNPTDKSFVVHGKRSKDRKMYLTGGAYAAFGDWLALRGTQAGYVFVSCGRSGKIGKLDAQMSAQSVYNVVCARANQASIPPISPHDFRRKGVSDLLAAGKDVIMVSRMAGHSNPATTAKYDRRPDTAQMEAAGCLEVPYKKQIYE